MCKSNELELAEFTEWLSTLLKKKSADKFYGKITLSFNNGVLQLVKEETSYHPKKDLGLT